MLVESIKFTLTDPLTGHEFERGRAYYSAVDEGVFTITNVLFPANAWRIQFATTHLTAQGRAHWEASPHCLKVDVGTLGQARHYLAEKCNWQNERFWRSMETWRTMPVAAPALAAPYRLVWMDKRRCMTIANDPRSHITASPGGLRWPDGTPKLAGSPVLAEAERHVKAEGALLSGWTVKVHYGRMRYREPFPNQPLAIRRIHEALKDYLPGAGNGRSRAAVR